MKTLSPGSRQPPVELFTVPGAQAIVGGVVPNPAGSTVAMTLTPCTDLHGTTGLFVRELSTGATTPIATSSNECDRFGPVAWNRVGTELVFPYARAAGPPQPIAGGVACPTTTSTLAITSVTDPRHAPSLIRPDHGCGFGTAAFDRLGLVATEGCRRGDPQPAVDSYLGRAYLLQYSPQHRVMHRYRLQLGLLESEVATDPHTGDVLITEDQPANQPYPERDWVWSFDGHHLKPIAHYPAQDAAQILAVPW